MENKVTQPKSPLLYYYFAPTILPETKCPTEAIRAKVMLSKNAERNIQDHCYQDLTRATFSDYGFRGSSLKIHT